MQEFEKLPENFATISDIKLFSIRGPWKSKSGGNLSVAFTLTDIELTSRYFRYGAAEVAKIPEEIRGLRIYTVRDIPQDAIGGTEFHRIREEIVFGLEGNLEWICEDLNGEVKTFNIDINHGVWMPPFILHTYKSLEKDSGILVVANTLFNPQNPDTHDTYPKESFQRLQKVSTDK